MAASRNASQNVTTARTASGRLSFAQIHEPLEVPDLLALQTESFDWLLGNERWQARVAAAKASGRTDVPDRSGLEEIFEEISPIEDFSGSMSLSFRDHRFEETRKTIESCKERDQTYDAPLFVTAEFMNTNTGEIKSQTVFMGDFPLMTERGTFIINGTERVVVSQLVRSPGAYFERTADKTSDKDIYTAKLIPSRGAWLEFEIDKRDMVGVRVDRKRKQSVTVLLKALGWTNDQILENFGDYESMRLTLEKDHTQGQDDALLDIYRKLRPGEPPTKEAAQALLDNLYFNPKRYDLAKVGRYKLGKKLGVEAPLSASTLSIDDIVATIRYIVALHAGETTLPGRRHGEAVELLVETDDIDHFGNRRLRSVGELIQNQVRTGLSRMERVVRERMTTQDVEAITPQTLINIRPVVASIREFFGTSQLSQFMDQNNPLSGLTHKRRLSALGPGGLSRDRAGMEVRDVHSSHYGRMCPIETPEGPNIGLIGSLASYGRINAFGFVETPYRKVVNGVVTDEVHYLSADEEDLFVKAQANAPLNPDGSFAEERVLVRTKGGEPEYIPGVDVDYMDVSARQMVSAATALIPFLEHDDANRALMGSNMQRQAVPLVKSEAPLVGTGMEYRAAIDSGDVVVAEAPGVVTEVSADLVTVAQDDGTNRTYRIAKFDRSNQGNCYNQVVRVDEGARLEKGSVIADGPATDGGEMALGRNLLVAFMPWEGHNYEDAIILSQRLVQDDVLSSIHIEEHEVDARDTKLGPEEITRDIPNVSEEVLADLDERGIIRIGAEVRDGDLLVGKVTPKGETELTPEERLLRAIFGEKAREVRDTSLKVPHGETGTVIGVKVFDKDDGDDLPPGVNQLVRVYVANKRKITDGDKLAGRHGNKGVISKILPIEDMPFLEDGTAVDVVLNPMGVPGRMNVGQILELHLGWAASRGWEIEGTPDWARAIPADNHVAEPGARVASPVFDGAREDVITGLLDSTRKTRDGVRLIDGSGKTRLFDGRSGEPFPEPVSVGYMYILKLHHLVDDKIHARSTGPYSMITQQPLGGKAQFGGQRFGEMEVWALEAYGAAYTLQELLTIKSDDVPGRVKVYEAIVKGENIPDSGIPESFKVLLKEMQSLCLNVEVLSSDGQAIEMKESDDDVFRAAEELGIDLSRREPSSVEEV
ncbi:MAG: DNA-directed RNA polymerase subunit beta [Actinomycetales bacterium]|uniref:DNA-directed RNA polymerase subunit beta n=1 Tax=Candidatus Phosphoribacter hodrii TaxID=2953743 RepID=A0A935CCC7_9MICO|nr:DNA-directed RNA polymerase subunit beta [Candidatus Phosphoribacter hodrii]MBP8882314.1 DNA-directed RNA polymerase subunit beta [Dermatophilaceae bacterium]MBK7273674.1 DNA-directed RNA polymerase subunit beta [Candidatus Phosphoribacter hodrii]MBL0003989.1 DNA-directed RNA polymerase subunit beta [Candidatus Phosphoribacter hodrii]HOR14698.1 DNA-directed RNA polymerase subunit beta [Dermatophilaceae bacterium]